MYDMLSTTAFSSNIIKSPLYWIIARGKKRYAPLHTQDRKLFYLKGTPKTMFHIPSGFKICNHLHEFKVKNMRASFKERLESLSHNDSHIDDETNASYTLKHLKSQKVQIEMVTMAWNILESFYVTVKSPTPSSSIVKKEQKFNSVLDIGCGDGHSTAPLCSLAAPCACIGVDINTSSLWTCKQNAAQTNSNLLHHSLHREKTNSHLPFTKTCFDAGLFPSSHNPGKKPGVTGSQMNISICDKECVCNTAVVDVVRYDLRHGLPFRSRLFDVAVSISFLQWLLFEKRQSHLNVFFSSLKNVLKPQGRAVIQFYPADTGQLVEAVDIASTYFQGVLVGDYPHIDRGRKLFLLLHQYQ